MKSQIEGHSHLYKDVETGVIVNRDTSDRNRYKIAKHQARLNVESKSEIDQLKMQVRELSTLKGEIEEIKGLLKQLLNK